jgi:hypothetical protein
MPASTEHPLTTFLLTGLSPFDVAEIRSTDPPYFEIGRHGRGVLVSTSPPPNLLRVGRRLPGDNRDVVGEWLEQSDIERLTAEYRKNRPGPEAQGQSLAAWREARERRVLLEHEIRELNDRRRRLSDELRGAKRAEHDATEEVIRSHGKTVMRIDGDLWILKVTRGGVRFCVSKEGT